MKNASKSDHLNNPISVLDYSCEIKSTYALNPNFTYDIHLVKSAPGKCMHIFLYLHVQNENFFGLVKIKINRI